MQVADVSKDGGAVELISIMSLVSLGSPTSLFYFIFEVELPDARDYYVFVQMHAPIL